MEAKFSMASEVTQTHNDCSVVAAMLHLGMPCQVKFTVDQNLIQAKLELTREVRTVDPQQIILSDRPGHENARRWKPGKAHGKLTKR